MEVIIPCAGQSSRYPGQKPKYLWTLPNGRLMFEAIAAHDIAHGRHVTLVVNKRHVQEYDAERLIKKAHPNASVIIVDDTSGPAETVSIACKFMLDQSIFVQDCDSFYDHVRAKGNHICVAKLSDYDDLRNVAAKSYVRLNHQNIILNIVEKEIISDTFCVGGYGFESSHKFIRAYEKLASTSDGSEIYVSHIIKHLMGTGECFPAEYVTNYQDFGTYDEFAKYAEVHSTYFIDIDGVLIKNQSRLGKNQYGDEPEIIWDAANHFLRKERDGAILIFTTSRPAIYEAETMAVLDKIGFKTINLLMDLPHAPRTVVNDYAVTNPYPSARAINVPRDSKNFWEGLK